LEEQSPSEVSENLVLWRSKTIRKYRVFKMKNEQNSFQFRFFSEKNKMKGMADVLLALVIGLISFVIIALVILSFIAKFDFGKLASNLFYLLIDSILGIFGFGGSGINLYSFDQFMPFIALLAAMFVLFFQVHRISFQGN